MLPFHGRQLLTGYLLLAFAAAVVVLPFLWILLTSFKQEIAIYSGALVFPPTLQNYDDVMLGSRSNFPHNVRNSLIVASVSTSVVLVVGTLAAYSLARLKWQQWIARGFLGWTLLFHMIPVLTIVGPWYLLFQRIGLYDSLAGLILTHITINLPMTVWLMMTFFRDLPPELEEAASMDGAYRFQTFTRVILPLTIPGLIASGILAFVFSWNEFSIALNLTSRNAATVPVGIAQFVQQFEIQNGQMAAAAVLSTIPALLLMLFGQRFVVQGLTVGTVK
jgi:multiple sugar transport system permease protein